MVLNEFDVEELRKIDLALYMRIGDIQKWMNSYPYSVTREDIKDLEEYKRLLAKVDNCLMERKGESYAV